MTKTKNKPNTETTPVRGAAYHQITGPHGLLARCVPFDGNSMRAEIDFRGNYRVFSYGTEIARRGKRGKLVLNVTGYSPTTTRHQNACAAWLQGNRPTLVENVYRGGTLGKWFA